MVVYILGEIGMLNINTNYGAAFAANAAKRTTGELDSAMEKLSSGSRINHSRDDAAGLAISSRISAELQGLAMASRNAGDAQSMIDTADGALAEQHTVLLRMRELSVQSANDTLVAADRTALNAEFQQLEAELDRIAHNTEWAGENILDGVTTSRSFQIGVRGTSDDLLAVAFVDMDATALALNTNDILTQAKSQTAITAVDAAIAHVSSKRAEFGAHSNRLESTMNNLDQISVNLTASQGRIQDADFAKETGNLAKAQIMRQAATAMVAQANVSQSSVLTLLRG